MSTSYFICISGVQYIISPAMRSIVSACETQGHLVGTTKGQIKQALSKAATNRHITPAKAAEWGSNLRSTGLGYWAW